MAGDWPMNDLEASLAVLYTRRYEEGRTAWNLEREVVCRRLRDLRDTLSSRYTNARGYALGGTSVVLYLEDTQLVYVEDTQPKLQKCILKFTRPSQPEREKYLKEALKEEAGHLASLRHSGIVRILGTGQTVDGCPYYIMDFVDGKASDDFLAEIESDLRDEHMVNLVETALEALSYMHSRSVVHLDIKPENVFVSLSKTSDGTIDCCSAVIADLGSARHLPTRNQPTTHRSPAQIDGDGGSQSIMVAVDKKYADPELLKRSAARKHDGSDPARTLIRIRASELTLQLDFVPLGRTILEWLGYDLEGSETTLRSKMRVSSYCLKYLLLVAARLLGEQTPDRLVSALGLNRTVLKSIRYEEIGQALRDVNKLSGRYSIVDRVPELNPYNPDTIRVASEGSTAYTDYVSHVVQHPALSRLRSVSQLGLVSHVFPTATHSRFEHSLGVYHFATKFAMSLYQDPLSPLFRQLVDDIDIHALLVCALLHDVGQFPLSHDLSDIDECFDHRNLASSIVKSAFGMDSGPECIAEVRDLASGLFKRDLFSPKLIEAIRAIWDVRPGYTSLKNRLLRSIVDGSLDADMLDYLTRDSENLRTPYASGLDLERILRNLTVVIKEEKPTGTVACIGVHEKARAAAEAVGHCLCTLYQQAYWHHASAAVKAMLARGVLAVMARANIKDLRNSFWRFAIGLPESLNLAQLDDLLPRPLKIAANAADAGVVIFFIRELADRPERKILIDLLVRDLYKRLFVFQASESAARTPWDDLVNGWDKLKTPEQKDLFVQELERLVCEKTGYGRTQQPFLALHIPRRSRIGQSHKELYYILESDRRALREDARVVGEAEHSVVWRNNVIELRRRAGKVRVFCHKDLARYVSERLKPAEFYELYLTALSASERV